LFRTTPKRLEGWVSAGNAIRHVVCCLILFGGSCLFIENIFFKIIKSFFG